jgi:GH15 family glucan-1,4-alpha-glucosidase
MAVAAGDLITERSLVVLRDGQSRGGAFVASPAFRVYGFGWLRDGAFCAHALDLVGRRAAADAFHAWAQRTIERHRATAEAAIALVEAGVVPEVDAMMPTRYTLDGDLEHPDPEDPWPNFQLDGYGIWLWSLEQHLRGRALAADQEDAVRLVARYLAASWRLRCWSCWEEFGTGEHASTLAAASAGLSAAARMLDDGDLAQAAATVRDSLLERFTADGYIGLAPGDDRVDASIAWISIPFGVLPPDDPLVTATIEAIKRQLIGPGGGVYRYRGDTYFGGGEWLILASSLAWHEATVGDRSLAADLCAWVRAQAAANGDLPEQVSTHAQDPSMIEPWIERWGAVANPLLWSHAMFLIAEAAL